MSRRVSVLRNYCWNWQKSKLWCDGWWQMWLQIKTKWIFLCHWAHSLQLLSKRMFLWSGSFTTTRWAKLMGSFESFLCLNIWYYKFCDTKKSMAKTAQFMTRDPRPPHQISHRVIHLLFFGQIICVLNSICGSQEMIAIKVQIIWSKYHCPAWFNMKILFMPFSGLALVSSSRSLVAFGFGNEIEIV